MAKIDKYFKIVLKEEASDFHLNSGAKPFMRKEGELIPIEDEVLTSDIVEEMLYEIINEEKKEKFLQEKTLDFSFEVSFGSRFRVNYFVDLNGICAAFRIVPKRIMGIKELGLPERILDFSQMNSGLVLVTGPTGCGKSSTLAAIIEHINETRKEHIITIEDPIEFVYKNKGSLINQRELGDHTNTFASALKVVLREDPDVILVGEMRDLETIELALTAAETGQLIFATLHTPSAAQTVDRIIDVFPEGKQAQIRTMLAHTLNGIIAQQLLKKTDKSGRVPAIELLFVNYAVSNLIREGKSYQIPTVMQTSRNEGMQMMDEEIMNYLLQKMITPEEAYFKANNKKLFAPYMSQNPKIAGQ
jgi:twitching motility protein PilT